jgi:hypothetical protein
MDLTLTTNLESPPLQLGPVGGEWKGWGLLYRERRVMSQPDEDRLTRIKEETRYNVILAIAPLVQSVLDEARAIAYSDLPASEAKLGGLSLALEEIVRITRLGSKFS